jgi:hypothetical protein
MLKYGIADSARLIYVSNRVKTTAGLIAQQGYRAESFASIVKQAEFNRMLAKEIIAHATSEWSSPVVLVPKRDVGKRFRVDYRKLNNLMEREVFPLPKLD